MFLFSLICYKYCLLNLYLKYFQKLLYLRYLINTCCAWSTFNNCCTSFIKLMISEFMPQFGMSFQNHYHPVPCLATMLIHPALSCTYLMSCYPFLPAICSYHPGYLLSIFLCCLLGGILHLSLDFPLRSARIYDCLCDLHYLSICYDFT
jgi:hypothetical protein